MNIRKPEYESSERFRHSLNGECFPRLIVNFDNGSLQLDAIRGNIEFLRLVREEALYDGFDFAANDTFVRAGKAGIAEKSSAAGEDLFVSGLDVCVSTDE